MLLSYRSAKVFSLENFPLYSSNLPLDLKWNHLTNVQLADPSFGQPGKINILLGIDVFVHVLLHGRWSGPPGPSVAFETKFGWVLEGETNSCIPAARKGHCRFGTLANPSSTHKCSR